MPYCEYFDSSKLATHMNFHFSVQTEFEEKSIPFDVESYRSVALTQFSLSQFSSLSVQFSYYELFML